MHKHHIATEDICASDLAYSAILPLMKDLDWDAQSIDIVIYITQTPDYIIPNTSALLHNKLKLKKEALIFDINLGCSGYIHGLWLLFSLLTSSRL